MDWHWHAANKWTSCKTYFFSIPRLFFLLPRLIGCDLLQSLFIHVNGFVYTIYFFLISWSTLSNRLWSSFVKYAKINIILILQSFSRKLVLKPCLVCIFLTVIFYIFYISRVSNNCYIYLADIFSFIKYTSNSSSYQ